MNNENKKSRVNEQKEKREKKYVNDEHAHTKKTRVNKGIKR